jgi:hypothetical protein
MSAAVLLSGLLGGAGVRLDSRLNRLIRQTSASGCPLRHPVGVDEVGVAAYMPSTP